MPTLDDRLTQALRDGERLPAGAPHSVLERIADKRRRRRARRRLGVGALAATLVASVAGVTFVILDRDRGDGDVRVATPSPSPSPPSQPEDLDATQAEIVQGLPDLGVERVHVVSATDAVVDTAGFVGLRAEAVDGSWRLTPASECRLAGTSCAGVPPDVRVNPGSAPLSPGAYAGTPVDATPVALEPDGGYVRGPLVPGDGLVWAAGYDRSGDTYTFPPSHVVGFDPATGGVTSRIDLQGEIQSLAEAEGALWAVTRERYVDPDGTEFRLKRIDPDGRTDAVLSNPLPPGEVPAGRVVAGAGAAWVPVRSGLLRFDATTGELLNRIALPEQDLRAAVVVEGDAWVSVGTTIQRVDAGDRVGSALDVTTAGRVTDLAVDTAGTWAVSWETGELVRLDLQLTTVEWRNAVPRGLLDPSLHIAGGRALVLGRSELAPGVTEPIVLQLGPNAVERTIVVAGGTDIAVAEQDEHLLLTSRGSVYRADLT